LILTYILSRTVSELLLIIAQIQRHKGYTLVQGEPLNSGPRNLP